jgi:hypothetical protein
MHCFYCYNITQKAPSLSSDFRTAKVVNRRIRACSTWNMRDMYQVRGLTVPQLLPSHTARVFILPF